MKDEISFHFHLSFFQTMPIRCEIVTQETTVFSEDVDYVSLPGREGVIGVLPNHSPLLTVLSFGEVYTRASGEEQFFAVGGGFAEVQPDKVIVLADAAERADQINLERAQEAREEAQRLMAEGIPDDPERYRMIEQSLRLAQIQIDVSQRRAAQMRQGRNRPPQFD